MYMPIKKDNLHYIYTIICIHMHHQNPTYSGVRGYRNQSRRYASKTHHPSVFQAKKKQLFVCENTGPRMSAQQEKKKKKKKKIPQLPGYIKASAQLNPGSATQGIGHFPYRPTWGTNSSINSRAPYLQL